jgi:WD40 repeat protein
VAADGRLVTSVSQWSVQLWDLAGGQCGRTLHQKTEPGLGNGAVALSADARYALSSSPDSWPLRLWDVTTGECVREFEASHAWAHTVRFTADGRFAVSGHLDSARVWDVSSGQCLRTLDDRDNTYSQTCLAVTPNGRFVLCGNSNGTIRLWELDWEMTVREQSEWDDGAAPYLEVFLRRYGPHWTAGDLNVLLGWLRDAGYGWLLPDAVLTHLNRMAARG